MQTNRADIADLTYFLAIARHRSFSRAAIEIGVSASALSHALKGLEGRLGVRLLNRTTKSVTLTAAGEALTAVIGEPFEVIDAAMETLNRFRDAPTGRIRLNVAVEAANLLLAPVLPAFAERYPDIELDIAASNRMVDVTDGRLRLVLPDWASMGDGFHIYYSSRRQVPTGLRLLMDLVRELQPLGL